MFSNEEDDDSGGECHQPHTKPKLAGIIEASLVDDWGLLDGRILDYIVGLYRHRTNSRCRDSAMGRGPNVAPVKMAS